MVIHSSQTYATFLEEYQKRTNNSQKTGHQEAPYGYDSVWAVAYMLNKSLTIMKEEGIYTNYVCIS